MKIKRVDAGYRVQDLDIKVRGKENEIFNIRSS